MNVEIWSDVVCPWCYIGKRRFETALRRFSHGDDVHVMWRSFQLNPDTPKQSTETASAALGRKYGMTPAQVEAANARLEGLAAEEGLDYHLATAHPFNTVDAHRLLHLAAQHGLQDAMKERLMLAYFTENLDLGEHETLIRLAAEIGLDRAEARDTLLGDSFAGDVRDDIRRAALLGITGVPFFVIDGTYGVSGAQTPDILLHAMERAWSDSHPLVTVATGHDSVSCEGDACAVTPAEAG
jgi:predicted DsbA family dithiol-disulfide isomerase